MLHFIFVFSLRIMQGIMDFLRAYQLPLLCALGGAGVGVYIYGSQKLSRLRGRQREEMRRHPDDPVPALPEKAKQSALAFEIAGFIILLVSCVSMAILGHFDRYLALLGIGG